MVFYGTHMRSVSEKVLKISIHKMSFKNTLLKLLPYRLINVKSSIATGPALEGSMIVAIDFRCQNTYHYDSGLISTILREWSTCSSLMPLLNFFLYYVYMLLRQSFFYENDRPYMCQKCLFVEVVTSVWEIMLDLLTLCSLVVLYGIKELSQHWFQ